MLPTGRPASLSIVIDLRWASADRRENSSVSAAPGGRGFGILRAFLSDRIRRTASSSRESGISPVCTASTSISHASRCSSGVWEMSTISAPALRAKTAPLAVPKYSEIAFISMQSVMMRPWNPKSRLNRPCSTGSESVAGRCGSIALKMMWAVMMAGSPFLMAALNGFSSTSAKRFIGCGSTGSSR